MKRIVVILLISAFLLIGCTNSEKAVHVFQTENITSVCFFTPNATEGIPVPDEDLNTIIDWLATFTVGDQAEGALIPGTNSISVRIEYADGSAIESGLSAVRIDDVLYYIASGDAPSCYLELINR